MRLNVSKFGLAGGILWGLSMFALTFANLGFGYGYMFLQLMADIYPGYEVSYFGSIVGLVYGFLDAGIGFTIFAWIYNKLVE